MLGVAGPASRPLTRDALRGAIGAVVQAIISAVKGVAARAVVGPTSAEDAPEPSPLVAFLVPTPATPTRKPTTPVEADLPLPGAGEKRLVAHPLARPSVAQRPPRPPVVTLRKKGRGPTAARAVGYRACPAWPKPFRGLLPLSAWAQRKETAPTRHQEMRETRTEGHPACGPKRPVDRAAAVVGPPRPL